MEGMKEYPDKYFDLCLTDPPFGLGIKYNQFEDTEENVKNLINSFFPEVKRVSKTVAVFSGITPMYWYPKPDWIMACVWNTTGSYGNMGFTQWQPVLFYGRDKKPTGYTENILKSDVIYLNGGNGVGFLRGEEKLNHPCPKPLNVVKKFVVRLSDIGDKIIDPFAGSGTMAIACEILGRDYVCFEIDKDYYEAAQKRIKQFRQQPTLWEQHKGQDARPDGAEKQGTLW